MSRGTLGCLPRWSRGTTGQGTGCVIRLAITCGATRRRFPRRWRPRSGWPGLARTRQALSHQRRACHAIRPEPTHAALDQVGPRLKRLRTQRRITLTSLANTTGISKGTLSRLETGQRRPALELLVALSGTYRVPLDDLVRAPDVGDPRVRLKPGRVKGRTVIPLIRRPDGMQACRLAAVRHIQDPLAGRRCGRGPGLSQGEGRLRER